MNGRSAPRLHDAYARRTPVELAFPRLDDLEAFAAAVERDALRLGVDPSDPQAFARLPAVASTAQRLEGEGARQGMPGAMAAFLYHAAFFQDAGRPLYLVDVPTVRQLTRRAPHGDPAPDPPSGYLQLPRHLVWLLQEPPAPPASVDGVFWNLTAGRTLHTLVVTGVVAERAGFDAVPLPEAPAADAPLWLEAEVRDGEDFHNPLPGAELDGLLGVRTAGEVLKLLARFFAHLHGGPGAARRAAPTDAPDASRIPYLEVRTHGEDR